MPADTLQAATGKWGRGRSDVALAACLSILRTATLTLTPAAPGRRPAQELVCTALKGAQGSWASPIPVTAAALQLPR